MSLLFRQHIEQIISLTDDEYTEILSYFKPKTYKKHQFIVQQEEPVSQEYFILKGLVKSYITGDDGKEHIIQFAMENWWVTDYQAYVNKEPATYNIDCVEATELLSITSEQKTLLCQRFHKMEHFFRVKATSGYIALQKRILSFMHQDTEQRYRQLFEQYPTLFQRVPKAMIASYLGVSRETLSRLSVK